MSKNSEAQNLERITKALERHDKNCDFPATAIYMNPFEVQRLDWDKIKGVPIRPDPNLQTGRFRIVCDNDHDLTKIDNVEAISKEKIYVS
jgi:hypothetical protein